MNLTSSRCLSANFNNNRMFYLWNNAEQAIKNIINKTWPVSYIINLFTIIVKAQKVVSSACAALLQALPTPHKCMHKHIIILYSRSHYKYVYLINMYNWTWTYSWTHTHVYIHISINYQQIDTRAKEKERFCR